MKMKDSYQTVPLPDGTVILGAFPTIEWYKAMAEHIDFKDKTVLDLGCCQFSYGVQAIADGAKFVTGVDNDPKREKQSREVIDTIWNFKNAEFFDVDIEEFVPQEYDIIIFSMIIHWLKDPELHIRRMLKTTKEKLVFIYRYPNPNKKEIGYRPSVYQLSTLLEQEPTIHTWLSKTEAQNITLAIYDKNI